MGLISKAFSDIITFSRSSNATRVGPDGTVQYAPHNLLLRSQELDNATWTKDNCTATANAIAAPDGTVTADMITDGASGSPSLYLTSAVTISASVPHTASGYVKRGNTDWIRFIVQDGSFGNQTAVWFNLATGATTSGGTLTSVGNGWYRFSVTATIGSATTAEYQINTATASSSNTRVSGGTYYLWGAQLSQGSIAGDYTPTTSAAVYGPRFDYDPVTLAAKGLLIEEQRTNLLTYSEDFTNGVWDPYNATRTANVTSAPNGTVTADQITPTGAGGHGVLNYAVLTSGDKSFSVYAKAAGYNFIALGNESEGHYAIFNLATGTVASTSGATISNAQIQSVGNGWYRVSCVVNTAATKSASILALQSAGSIAYTADGTSGIYVWGAQLEAGAFATSYIPTVASTVTRSADVASVNTLSPWFNATEGTLFAETTFKSSAITTDQLLFNVDDGSNNNRTKISRYNGIFYATTTSSTVTAADFGIGSASSTITVYKVAACYKANDFAGTSNGGTVITDTSGSLPSGLTTARIGASVSGEYLNGHIRRIAYYPRRLTNAELIALTA